MAKLNNCKSCTHIGKGIWYELCKECRRRGEAVNYKSTLWYYTEDVGEVLEALRTGKLVHGKDNGTWELVVEVGASVVYWAHKEPMMPVATKYERPFRIRK